MKKKEIKVRWCGWPNVSYAREMEDLFKVGIRCDAWRSFLSSETAAKLKKIKGHIIWFNRYEYFDKLICEFDCSEKRLRNVIKSLMRVGHEKEIEFIRNDIYDARAWTRLPLSCFAEVDGCLPRSGKDLWQCEVLEHNEMPVILFGIKLPWTVSRNCFALTHRLKHGKRHAEMTFSHPQLDYRFDNKRWVAEKTFPKETNRKEMTEDLFAKAEDECTKHLVTIID